MGNPRKSRFTLMADETRENLFLVDISKSKYHLQRFDKNGWHILDPSPLLSNKPIPTVPLDFYWNNNWIKSDFEDRIPDSMKNFLLILFCHMS